MEFKTVARATGTQHSITCASPVSQTPDQLVLKRPPEAAISCSVPAAGRCIVHISGQCRDLKWTIFMRGVYGRGGGGSAGTKLRPTFPPWQSATRPAQPSPGRQKSLNYWVSAPARPAQPCQHPPPPLRPVADWIMAPLTIFIPDIELLCSVYKHFIIASFNW